jgi:tetratricopeptide (TPR) repeat protein
LPASDESDLISALSSRNKKNLSPRSGQRTAIKPVSSERLLFFRLALLLLPLLLLGLLEITLRLGGYGYDLHFFKRLKIGGEDFFVQNEDFSRRFFPEAIMRNPGPVRFPVHKALGTFRIFILGESAAMGDPEQSFAPDRYLEMLLREKYPDRKFEAINVAFTAINSNVILPIARECAAHEGDLWIVYMGNNEMVGPFGAATVFGRKAAPLWYVRLVTESQRPRIGQWLMELRRKVTGQGEPTTAWGGMGMFLHNQIAPDSPLKETVYRNFENNLHKIVRAGVDSDATVLLNTVAVNLADCPPFASMTDSHLSPADRAQFDLLCTNGTQAGQRESAAAAALFERAAHLDSRSAELQFQWGVCCLAQSNVAGAREHLQLACNNDALPFRADSRINAAIRAEQERTSDKAVILCDAPAKLSTEAGICGRETFFEHVHFDFGGRYRLARAWAEQIEPLLPRNGNAWVSQAVCEQMLGLSEWNRAQVIHFMVERMQVPPLSSQANNGRRRDALEARINELGAQMSADRAASTRKAFLKLVERRPDDYFLHENFAVFLELAGDPVAAVTEWQHFRELLPHDSTGYYQAGRLLIPQQRYAEAEASLRTALAIRPSRTEAWIELGNALALEKKYADALRCFSTALEKDPQNAQTLLRRGRVLANLNLHAQAMESYRAAIQLNPADALFHYELGLELVATAQLDAAGREFGEAARLNPANAAARFNYGAFLMQRRQWDEAQREFEAVVRLEPGNQRAQQNLARLQAMTRRSP